MLPHTWLIEQIENGGNTPQSFRTAAFNRKAPLSTDAGLPAAGQSPKMRRLIGDLLRLPPV